MAAHRPTLGFIHENPLPPISVWQYYETPIWWNVYGFTSLRTVGRLSFLKTFFSLDAWKEAFPFSTRSVYLALDGWYSWKFDLPPHLLKHVRGLLVFGTVKPAVLPPIESMIRNKDYGIEEVKFDCSLLKHAELLDDTLRRIRSFRVNFESEDDVDRLLREQKQAS